MIRPDHSPIFALCASRRRPLPESTAERLAREAEELLRLAAPVDRDARRMAWERSGLKKAA